MRSNPVVPWPLSRSATLFLLVPFNLLAALGMDMYLPVVPGMAHALGADADAVQLTLSLYLVLLGAGQLLFGPLSDRYGRRPVLLAGAMSFAMASLGLAMASSYAVFMAWRLVQAAAAAACMVCVFATVRDLYGGKPEGSLVYGMLGAALAVMPAVGPLFGAMLDAWMGWRAIFALLGTAMALMLLAALGAWRETRRAVDASARPGQLLRPLSSRRFWWYMAGYGTGMGAFFVCFSTAPWLMMQRMGHSQFAFSGLFATIAVAMIVASRLAGSLASRWGTRRSLQRGMACLPVAALLLACGESFIPDLTASALVPMWIAGFGMAIANAVAPNGALRGLDEIAGVATAWFFCLGGLFAALSGTMFTALLPMDTRWPLAAYCLVLPLLVLAGSRKARPMDDGQ